MMIVTPVGAPLPGLPNIFIRDISFTFRIKNFFKIKNLHNNIRGSVDDDDCDVYDHDHHHQDHNDCDVYDDADDDDNRQDLLHGGFGRF